MGVVTGLPLVSNVRVLAVTTPVQPVESYCAANAVVPALLTLAAENDNEVVKALMAFAMLVKAAFKPDTIPFALPAKK